LQLHGAVKGSALAIWRLLRCNPWSNGGVDPVPGSPLQGKLTEWWGDQGTDGVTPEMVEQAMTVGAADVVTADTSRVVVPGQSAASAVMG